MIERFMVLHDNKYLSKNGFSRYFSNSEIEEFCYWKTKGGAERRLQKEIEKIVGNCRKKENGYISKGDLVSYCKDICRTLKNKAQKLPLKIMKFFIMSLSVNKLKIAKDIYKE